jgi:hypothetical protein
VDFVCLTRQGCQGYGDCLEGKQTAAANQQSAIVTKPSILPGFQDLECASVCSFSKRQPLILKKGACHGKYNKPEGADLGFG